MLAVLDASLDHDPPYFVMPLAAGTLEAELRGRSGDAAWAVGAFRQICLGVQALHEAGVVHRDLKPANVLRLDDGRYVVADLGTAKREPRDSTVLTRTCAILGTLSYLAPEQLLPGGSRQADARTDVFQLGKILYQMVTGRSPAVIETARLRPALAHIVLRATAPDPSDRYADVAALLEAVEAYENCRRGSAETIPAPRSTRSSAGSAAAEPAASTPGSMTRRSSTPCRDSPSSSRTTAIDVFDRLPIHVLTALAGDPRADLLVPLLAYATALEHAAPRRHFDYADKVAVRMEAVFQAAREPRDQGLRPPGLLVAAVALNRYAAMAAFKRLLYSDSRRGPPSPSPRCSAIIATTSRRSRPTSAPIGWTPSSAP